MPKHQHDGAAAPWSVTSTSEGDDAHELAGCAGIKDGSERKEDSSDSAEMAQERKRVAKAAAVLALDAIQLHELRTGGFMATSHGLVAHLSDLVAVEAWVKRRGGRP